MSIIQSVNDLHGVKSKCGKFTINIDKGYLAVASNFHDKARIVYSEPIENIDGIFKDLYNIFNFNKYEIVNSKSNNYRSIVYDNNGKMLAYYCKITDDIWFANFDIYSVYCNSECWDTFTDVCKEIFNCTIL